MPTAPPPPPPLPPKKPADLFRVSVKNRKEAYPIHTRANSELAADEDRSPRRMVDAASKPFQPCHMFFYGSLMDPEVIQTILSLPALPTTRRAIVSDFKVKMWGIYPAVVPHPSGSVSGAVWKIESEEHFKRLAAYETSAYDWVECDAILENGSVVSGCRLFCWAGAPDSKELEEGSFDFERYQRYFKPSMVRPRESAA